MKKTGEKLKLPFVPSRPIYRNQFCRSRGRSHIYIFVPDLQTHGPHGPTCKRTDGRTLRSTDGHADGRTDTQKHGRRRTRTDADASARTLNICACSARVEKSSRRRTRLDERTRTFEVYYSFINISLPLSFLLSSLPCSLRPIPPPTFPLPSASCQQDLHPHVRPRVD